MYEVNVTNLKNEVNKFNKILDTYQENYLNLYNEIRNSNMYWMDPHAINFFDAKEIEKNKIDISFEELTSVKETYNLIINRYERIGNFIEFNLSRKEELLSKLNTYINKLNRILNSYRSLDYSFASGGIKSQINSQINTVRLMISNATSLRNNVKNLLNNIFESENKIRTAIANIQVEVLSAPTIQGFVTLDGGK